MLNKPKDRRIAVVLAFAGAILPVAGLHKFYLGQRGWGILYLLLSLSWMSNPIPRIASLMEGVWYLLQGADEFDRRFNADWSEELGASSRSPAPPIDITQLSAIADAMRQLDQLRLDGLISEYEFEQKRRQLLDRMG